MDHNHQFKNIQPIDTRSKKVTEGGHLYYDSGLYLTLTITKEYIRNVKIKQDKNMVTAFTN